MKLDKEYNEIKSVLAELLVITCASTTPKELETERMEAIKKAIKLVK